MNFHSPFIFYFILFLTVTSCDYYVHDNTIETYLSKKTEKEYIAVFGDIQYYTNDNNINLYERSLDWLIHEKKSGMPIQYVLHTGDITQSNSINQWESFYTSMLELSKTIPI